ncbi:hypothetical protein [Pseudomonas aeruginosa]|uniref:hypothetical protein n=1 Tax=Pseudomonas aeruginosa TaxID=287 RepID=UPI002F3F1EB9
MVIDLQTRELTRRNVLWALDNQDKHNQATEDLLRVWRADRDYPIGPAADLTVDEIRALVPIHVEEGGASLVRYSEIPEPWATRFQIASFGSARALDRYFACDWEKFLDFWVDEAERIDDLLERELEQQVIAGIQRAQARSAAVLADLGLICRSGYRRWWRRGAGPPVICSRFSGPGAQNVRRTPIEKYVERRSLGMSRALQICRVRDMPRLLACPR